MLEGKVAMVIGTASPTTAGIVSALLHSGCTVMAPAKNLQQLKWLKEIAGGIPSGRLLTQITDMPDYEKAQDLADATLEKYGRIDIAVIAMLANKVSTGLSETCMNDWENMLEECITPCFVFNRILISMMKQEQQGVYINVSERIPEGKSCSSLSKMAATVQLQLSQQFAEEATANGIRYYNLFVQAAEQQTHNPTGNTDAVAPENIGAAIIELYAGKKVYEPVVP